MAASSMVQCRVEAPNGRRLLLKVPPPTLTVARVEPSFTSSDLFTPFCAPRTTLPTIAKFVRPSYGKDNTWGQLTSSYGGVGPAADTFRKTNRGSISRSHRHYGTGCVTYNYHTMQPSYSGAQFLLTCDCSKENEQTKTSTDRPPVNGNIEPVGAPIHDQTEEMQTPPVTSTTLSNNTDTKVTAVAPVTVHALESLYTQLYGMSTYKKDFVQNVEGTDSLTPAQSTPASPPVSENDDTTSTFDCKINESMCMCKSASNVRGCPCVNDNNEDKDFDQESDNENFIDESESNDHCIPINHVLHLPVHFRRITTKYTRNKCTTIPCKIPYYLYYKHCLLPSYITTSPNNYLNQSTWKDSRYHHHQHRTTNSRVSHDSNTTDHHDIRPVVVQNDLPDLSKRLPHGHLKPLTTITTHRHKNLQQLGQQFRSQAHARFYHTYPNQVPDLRRTEKSSRRHTFFGHHATVFRG